MARHAEAVRTLVGQTAIQGGTDEHALGARLEEVSRALLPLAAGTLGAGRDTAVAFADVVGFTELGETIPVEELGSVAGRLSQLAGAAAEPPVKVVKQIGDAVMLVSPEARELVASALALVEASGGEDELPALRAGIAFGPAVNRWGDWYGSTVNVASRLTERARPSSVLVTEAVREAAGDGFEWSYAGEKRLKGLSTPLRTYRARPLTATSAA